jgi:polyhydroxybutyrate depolymerase
LLLALGALAFGLVAVVAVLGPGASPASATPCSPARPQATGASLNSITTSQGSGEYRLYIPASYDGTMAVPLVLNMHGLGSNALEQHFYTEMYLKADIEGFILVEPDGNVIEPGGIRHWNSTQQGPPERDDVAFLGELLDWLEGTLCIDASRIYSTGMSNGGLMSVRLGCSLSSRIAAIAPVAGAYYPPVFDALPDEDCPDTRPVPIIAFHGTDDTTVPFVGGPSPYGVDFRLPIDDAAQLDVMESWAAHNGCSNTRQLSPVTANVNLVEYLSCTDDAEVQLYRVEGGTHTWPDAAIDLPGEVTTHEISANDLMWAFFEQHPLGPKSAPPTPTPKNPDADTDGDTVLNSVDADDDNDGCLDTDEAQQILGSQTTGGRRDPHYFWDFYDVWARPNASSPWTRDRVITVTGDIFGVAKRFGAMRPGGAPSPSEALLEALTPPTSDTGYHTAFDRGPLVGPNLWNSGPPDGAITVTADVLQVARAFGHSCL